jgi:hypothetical protein
MYSNCQFISGCTNIAEVRDQELVEVRNQEVAGIWSRELTKL